DNEDPLEEGAWGPVTQSQPYTYFWDFWMQDYVRATPKEEPSFRMPMTHEVERPTINEDPEFEVQLEPKNTGSLFSQRLDAFCKKKGISKSEITVVEYFVRNDKSENEVYFKEYQNIESGIDKPKRTRFDDSKLFSTIEGIDAPQPAPGEHPVPNQKEPAIPEYILPEQDINDFFGAKWSAFIYAPKAGIYEFEVMVNDAVALWVNAELLIDEWHENKDKTYKASIYLNKGQWYPIKVHYADMYDEACIKLKWKIPNEDMKRIDRKYVAPTLTYTIHAETKKEYPMPWNQLIHNGHYYFQNKEHFMYATKEIKNTNVTKNNVTLYPKPKQGAPVLITKSDGVQLRKVSFVDETWKQSLVNHEYFNGNGKSKYYLQYEDIDSTTLKVYLNELEVNYIWNQEESSIVFDNTIHQEDDIHVSYVLNNSFYIDINHDDWNDSAEVVFHNPSKVGDVEIVYEADPRSPFY